MIATLSAYGIQLFSFSTLVITLFINNGLHAYPDHPKSRLITQINWMAIGAALVAAMINITAILGNLTGILVIAFVITTVTLVLTTGCLVILRDPDTRSATSADTNEKPASTATQKKQPVRPRK